jgi:transcriptional regulator with XRE-family HTH domain
MKEPEAKSCERTTSNGSAIGRLLKDWRGRRSLSQLDLAVAAHTTQRHLSFIETGRDVPSREMVLRLGATLSLPLRQQNALLLAAGSLPKPKRQAALGIASMKPVTARSRPSSARTAKSVPPKNSGACSVPPAHQLNRTRSWCASIPLERRKR